MPARIAIDPDMIADFCQRNHIRKLALFGSVLRDDFTPESDVDVLVEFEPEARQLAGCRGHGDRPIGALGAKSRSPHCR